MKKEQAKGNASIYHGVGRRKSAVARVWMKPGKGKISVNGRDYSAYFNTEATRKTIGTALTVAGHEKKFDISVNVDGGGQVGQAGAARLGIARALLSWDETLRPLLKKNALLTVDSRVKERKKYGQRGARAKFQFVKR